MTTSAPRLLFSFPVPFLVLIATLLTLPACRKNLSEDPSTLVIALSAAPSTLDPRFTTDATGSRIAGLLYSSLVKTGPDLRVVGDAATSWSYNNLTYRFELKPKIQFSDGQPLTKEDILASFEFYRGPQSPFASSFQLIRSVEAHYDGKDRFVLVTLSEPSAAFLADLSSLKLLRKADLSRNQPSSELLAGSGPCVLITSASNEISLRVRTSETHSTTKVQNLVFKIIRDDNTRFLKILKGEIDIAQQELPPQKVRALEKRDGFQIIKSPGLSMTYLLLNLKDPVLAQKPIREAISKAIDRQAIITYKLEGLAQLATSILTPINPYFLNDLVPFQHDPNSAREVFTENSLTRTEISLKTSSLPSAIENGKVIAHQLNSLGFAVKLQSYEWGTYYGDIQNGRFQMAIMRWVGTIDPDIYRKAFHSLEVPPRGRNRGFYFNPPLDLELEKGIKITDPKQRFAHYRKIQSTIYQDLPIIPLWYDMEVAVAHSRVRGYSPARNGDYSAFLNVSKELSSH